MVQAPETARPKVMTVYGTRPEAIKVAPVITRLNDDPRFESVAVSTGQHREILAQVNAMFGITPAHDLELMRTGQGLNELVARALTGLDRVIEQEHPDVVIAQGDTSTAMSAALAAFYRGVPVVHLEAGLRTGNIHSPFPEEANRRLIGQVTAVHLAPTAGSRDNLLHENFSADDIVVTGNTVIDALVHVAGLPVTHQDARLAEAVAGPRRIVLVTAHRRENLAAMNRIGQAVAALADSHPEEIFVLPLHPNPKVRDAMVPEVSERGNVIVLDPLPYDEFSHLQRRADLILTDSGGVQEEAPTFGTPVLVLRDTTERPEAVEYGTVRLVGTDSERIVAEGTRLLDDPVAHAAMAAAVNPCGDGHAAERAVAAIAQLTGVGERVADFAAEPAEHREPAAVEAL
ncbi:non-hydrolyzing UDP-N-acetylglucosamine 2-epimerase [Corynebacterium frankenforstense]